MSHDHESSRAIAPDDVCVGDYVTIGHETVELLPDLIESNGPWRGPVRAQRVRVMFDGAGYPLKVESICLPFVLVKTPAGCRCTLDLRRHHLHRLSKPYGKRVFRALASKPAKADKRGRKHRK